MILHNDWQLVLSKEFELPYMKQRLFILLVKKFFPLLI